MKRFLCLFLLLILIPACALGKQLNIGLCVYNATDTFIMSVIDRINSKAGEDIRIEFKNANNDQNLQNRQIEELIDSDVNVLIVNAVDRTSAVYLIRLCREKQIPVVFINREPLKEDMSLYDKAYYVGVHPHVQGRMCGEIVADYFRKHPEADKNRDGKIQYVLLKGEPGHQDAELRTIHSILALQEEGMVLDKLAEDSGYWRKAAGQQIMSRFLLEFDGRIECVISNNDDMALGAIDALKAAGYFSAGRRIPVVGVDATVPAMEALKQGTLSGTVLNDSENQGDAALLLATLLAKGETVTPSNFPYTMDEAGRVWIPGRKIVP